MNKKRIEDGNYFWDEESDQWYPIGSDEEITPGKAPSLVTHTGNVINKTSGDWKNLMDNIKKGSGKGNTVKS